MGKKEIIIKEASLTAVDNIYIPIIVVFLFRIPTIVESTRRVLGTVDGKIF